MRPEIFTLEVNVEEPVGPTAKRVAFEGEMSWR